ncbi:MAG: hypothetical protein OXH73_13465 [Caldilineaceae bacterium]|nr:hypothetical protein [Caldilineaceae bacterium]
MRRPRAAPRPSRRRNATPTPLAVAESKRCDIAPFARLYGLSRADAAHILDTFPIVRRRDQAAFSHYRTKHMVLAYYNALAAGDTDTDVAA